MFAIVETINSSRIPSKNQEVPRDRGMFNVRPYQLAILVAAWQLHRQKPWEKGRLQNSKDIHYTLPFGGKSIWWSPSRTLIYLAKFKAKKNKAPIPSPSCPASALGHLHPDVAPSFPILPCARTLELAAVHPVKVGNLASKFGKQRASLGTIL